MFDVLFIQKHFEPNRFLDFDGKKLKRDAVPTIFDIPNPPKKLTLQRKANAGTSKSILSNTDTGK